MEKRAVERREREVKRYIYRERKREISLILFKYKLKKMITVAYIMPAKTRSHE